MTSVSSQERSSNKHSFYRLIPQGQASWSERVGLDAIEDGKIKRARMKFRNLRHFSKQEDPLCPSSLSVGTLFPFPVSSPSVAEAFPVKAPLYNEPLHAAIYTVITLSSAGQGFPCLEGVISTPPLLHCHSDRSEGSAFRSLFLQEDPGVCTKRDSSLRSE